MRYFRTHFPKTALFVGVRHPVSLWQSLYNFRVQNYDEMPHPRDLIGRCAAGMKGTCTEKTNFAFDLMRMGKTNEENGPRPTTELEEKLVGRFKAMWYNVTEVQPIPNRVFFYDIAQLADRDEERQFKFRKEVSNFLGLETIVPPLIHVKPGKNITDKELQAKKDRKKINICDNEYANVRAELMTIARLNSLWIRQVFLDLPGIITSSREFLEQILLGWMDDPCETSSMVQ